MTDEELKSIRSACEAATVGPWNYVYDGSSDWSIGQAEDPQELCVAGIHDRTDERALRDAPFIAGARSWLPALLDEVERLRAEVVGQKYALQAAASLRQDYSAQMSFQARSEALEEAARVAETECASGGYDFAIASEDIAAAIRALKDA